MLKKDKEFEDGQLFHRDSRRGRLPETVKPQLSLISARGTFHPLSDFVRLRVYVLPARATRVSKSKLIFTKMSIGYLWLAYKGA